MSAPDTVEGITVVPRPSAEQLGERQRADYAEFRERLLRWCLDLGKNPEKGEGYAFYTIRGRASLLDQFFRFVWDQEGSYTTNVTHDHADAFSRELATRDVSQDNKSSHQKAMKMYFRWRAWETGDDDVAEWEPQVRFTDDTSTSNPRDYLTKAERRAIRDVALEYGSVPSYSNLNPDERDRWKIHLAQRFEKPKSEVTPDDFERANSWKVPSLVWVSLDAGLRPIEVERAQTTWVDTQNSVLRIPREDSSKNEEHWVVSLTDRTANALQRWLLERENYAKYDDTDTLWLNRDGNPYKHYSLKRLLRKLCDVAGIDHSDRQMTWYSIRHSVGTYMTREEGLAAAQAQLRHKSERTTMRYDQAPTEDRRDALNRMG